MAGTVIHFRSVELPATKPDPPHEQRPSIRDWPESDRPRERLLRQGSHALTDSELLAILLRTGDRRHRWNAVDQARALLDRAGGLAGIARLGPGELKTLAGLGPAKAAQVIAALSLSPRLERALLEERPQVSSSKSAHRLLREQFSDAAAEELITLLLDTKNRLLRVVRAGKGGVGAVAVDVASLFRDAVREGAAALILSHNHPSGDPTPSEADRRLTREACSAGHLLSVRVLDHIVVAGPRYFSFLDEGLMD